MLRIQSESSDRRQQSTVALLQRGRDLVRTRNAVVFGLAKLADYRDQETGQHLERIALYSTKLAAALRSKPQFRNQIDAGFIKTIGISSALHDIGKVSIEDAILRKPGKLTSAERTRIQEHTSIGGECIRQIESRLGNSNFLQMARQIAFYHHERWDGCGYPDGLRGTSIPLAARIVAVADVYDALSVKRVYKDAMPHQKCVRIISEEAGRQFDPDVVDVFLRIEAEFREIARRFADRNGQSADNETGTAQPAPRPSDNKVFTAMLEADVGIPEATAATS